MHSPAVLRRLLVLVAAPAAALSVASPLAGPGAGYVTVLIGANDACRDSESQMTPVAAFRGQAALAQVSYPAGFGW